MGVPIFESAINKAGSSPDKAFKFALGYVVRTEKDSHISRTGAVSVITEDGVYYQEVLLPRYSRFIKEFPHTPENADTWGSRVVIGFIDNSVNKPYIICYLPDTDEPSADLPMNYWGFSNNSLKVTYDGFAHTSIVFDSGSDILELLMPGEDSKATLSFEGTVEKFINKYDFQSIDSKVTIQNIEESFEQHIYTTRTLEETITEKQTQKIEELEQEIKQAKSKIEKLEAEVKEHKQKSDKYVLDCKDISLTSESPSDSAVLFNQLNTIMTNLLSALQVLTVTCSSPGSPSSPPLNVAQFAQIQGQLMTMKSKYIKID